MAIIYREVTDCDGWHNGGAIAFSTNFSAYRHMALELGETLMSGNLLLYSDETSWSVSTEEGHRAWRVDYMTEVDGHGVFVTDHLGEEHDSDVSCDCPVDPDRAFLCRGHRVSWNGRTPVDLPVHASM